MLYNEKQDVRVRRWNWLLLFCLSLALVVSANGTALDKRIQSVAHARNFLSKSD
jgi:hypothetical protein